MHLSNSLSSGLPPNVDRFDTTEILTTETNKVKESLAELRSGCVILRKNMIRDFTWMSDDLDRFEKWVSVLEGLHTNTIRIECDSVFLDAEGTQLSLSDLHPNDVDDVIARGKADVFASPVSREDGIARLQRSISEDWKCLLEKKLQLEGLKASVF